MKPETIARSYDKLADHWASNAFNRENGIEVHKRAIEFAQAKHWFLDIGCGSSGRIIDLMLENGYRTEAVDFSPEMLRLARKRHPTVTFHEADICTWTPKRQFDLISAWDSIWHVPLAEQEGLYRRILSVLAPAGVFIFSCGGLDEEDERTNPCMSQPMYHATLGLPKIQQIITEEGSVIRHLEFDQLPQPHVAIIVQKR